MSKITTWSYGSSECDESIELSDFSRESLERGGGWTEPLALCFCKTFIRAPNVRVAFRANGMGWRRVRDWALGTTDANGEPPCQEELAACEKTPYHQEA